MAKRKREPERAAEPSARELTHNPFTALAGIPSPSPTSISPAAPSAKPAPPAKPAPKFDRKLVIRRELKGRGGKTITRISGLPPNQRDALLSRLKKKLGCGAVVEGEDVLLLGDLLDRAADWLAEQGAPRIIKGN
jgi:translation initiation factor 1